MRRQMLVMALITLVTLGACLTASAQGVRFITPQDGDTVRGLVKVQATKPNPNEGWISYKIQSGGQGDFVAAVTSPYVYTWNTLSRDDEGNDLYKDGQYTLVAVAMSPNGRKVGEASITVTLKNALSASEAPQRVDLKLWYDRNVQALYRAEGEWKIRPAEDEENPEDVWQLARTADGQVIAEWKNKVMSPTIAAGHALLHVVVGRAGEQRGTEPARRLSHSGKSHTYMALRDGEMRLKHDDETSFPFVEMGVVLPEDPVRVGDRWSSDISVQPIPYSDVEMRTVRAQHRVEGFEVVFGQPCVRIRSTFSVDKEKIRFSLQPTQQGLGGDIFGGMPGEPGMMGMPPEPAMMGVAPEPAMMGMAPEPAMMGMPPEAMMPGFGDTAMMGMGMAQAAEIETSYTGERITWWAYELHRPIRIMDSITHSLELPRQAAAQFGMTEAMPGMPMEAMMGMPGGFVEPPLAGAQPPMMAPEAGVMVPPEPGAPGAYGMMPGYGMGAEGLGMGMAQQAKPMKVRIKVALLIEETDL